MLSFHDRLCLFLARDNGSTFDTNDVRLRRERKAEGVVLLGELELVALLVKRNVLDETTAAEIGATIGRASPALITAGVFGPFLQRVREFWPQTST